MDTRQQDIELLQMVRKAAKDGRAKKARQTASLTQAELGTACGVTRHAIAQWEAGRRVPRGEPALRYALLLTPLLDQPSESLANRL